MKGKIVNKVLALAIVCSAAAAMIFLPLYPCHYYDANTGWYAGWGHHSLADIASNGLEWDSAELPNRGSDYTGDGPYIISADAWILLLYIPIFLALLFLGAEIGSGRVAISGMP